MRTALIIDDEADSSRSLARVLRLRGWETDVVATAEAARELIGARGKSIAAIVVDAVGPERPGIDVAAELALLLPEALIVVTSGYTPAILASVGVTVDRARFLSKPFDVNAVDALFGPRID